ncbi:MAG: helix-turn-helix domain-containing protein [Candidatus Limnocylindrales bacterium]
MSVQNGRAFNEWLRSQLKAKKMSQRQLAQQSGVDHSTISRLIRGDRTPSLGTATKLARGLREIHDEADTPQYFGLVATAATNPTARVEYSLRSDDYLSEAQVRQVMEYYLAVRMRRLAARPSQAAVSVGAAALSRFPQRNCTRPDRAPDGARRTEPTFRMPAAGGRHSACPGGGPTGPVQRPARPGGAGSSSCRTGRRRCRR